MLNERSFHLRDRSIAAYPIQNNRCEFFLSIKRNEIHDERISEFELYEDEIVNTVCIYTKATKERSKWCPEKASQKDSSGVSVAQGLEDSRWAHNVSSRIMYLGYRQSMQHQMLCVYERK